MLKTLLLSVKYLLLLFVFFFTAYVIFFTRCKHAYISQHTWEASFYQHSYFHLVSYCNWAGQASVVVCLLPAYFACISIHLVGASIFIIALKLIIFFISNTKAKFYFTPNHQSDRLASRQASRQASLQALNPLESTSSS